MRSLREWAHRLWGTLSRRRSDADMAEELRLHEALGVEDAVRRGLVPAAAARAAAIAAGGHTQAMEALRDQRGLPWLDEARQDLRYAARTLRKNRAFTTAAAATLALAIGTNTAMFSVLNAVLLRPLPYRSPDQLVMLWTEDPTQNLREGRSALWDVEQWRSQSQSFADMGTFDAVSTTLTGADGAEQIVGAAISPNLLSLLGVQPVQGRSWSIEEAEQRHRLVLISHRFWQARFGGSDDAVGATIVLDGLPFQIIGVLPAGFRIASLDADVWRPHTMSKDWET